MRNSELRRPWLRADAEGAGRFTVGVIKAKPKRQRDYDADLAAFTARCAAHWANLAIGER